jgi:hypothetical protein
MHLPDAIGFELAAASFLKGPDTAGGGMKQEGLIRFDFIGLAQQILSGQPFQKIACQWAKALGAHLIGTVGSAEKATLAKNAGAWATVIHYANLFPLGKLADACGDILFAIVNCCPGTGILRQPPAVSG